MNLDLDSQRVSHNWKFYVFVDKDGEVSQIRHAHRAIPRQDIIDAVSLEHYLLMMTRDAPDPRMDMRAILTGMAGTALILGGLWVFAQVLSKAMSLIWG